MLPICPSVQLRMHGHSKNGGSAQALAAKARTVKLVRAITAQHAFHIYIKGHPTSRCHKSFRLDTIEHGKPAEAKPWQRSLRLDTIGHRKYEEAKP